MTLELIVIIKALVLYFGGTKTFYTTFEFKMIEIYNIFFIKIE